jgi:hypothetical protein
MRKMCSQSRFVSIPRLSICAVLTLLVLHAEGARGSRLYSIPEEITSKHFVVTVDGRSTPVVHATTSYYLLNFEVSKAAIVSVTASDVHYWDAGVEIQPMRFGIRPRREGAKVTFQIPGPLQLSITRPGDHFGDSEMLFLFANPPETLRMNSHTHGIRYYGPGVHHESIVAHSGETIYLDRGAVLFGGLTLWDVHDVRVLGRGTLIYEGPQNPDHDEGWIHKPDWHVIVMHEAKNVEIDGITGIARSRTWMVQMRDSHQIKFRNVKIVGGSPGNANQDGFDWLGGGDTVIQDSFVRAADDIFAIYGNWDGYQPHLMTIPGHKASNITIERSVLSTSISNVVRLSWPTKTFDSSDFTLRDSDVIHMGIGGCGVPFALFEVWADPDGKGRHTGYTFENIRMDDWYSLLQLRQPEPAVRDVTLKNVWAMDVSGGVPSVLKGDISGVTLDGVNTGFGEVETSVSLPLEIQQGAQTPSYLKSGINASFQYTHGLLRPDQRMTFTALSAANKGLRFDWVFGDGSTAHGRQVGHVFPDTEGTSLDGSGRFRVLLHVSDGRHEAWSSQTVVIVRQLQAAAAEPAEMSDGDSQGRTFDGYIRVPEDGGYTFTLLTSAEAKFSIDELPLAHSPKPRTQVCDSPGDAVQATRVSAGLAKGWHHIRVFRGPQIENAASISGMPSLYWEGPGVPRQRTPEDAYYQAKVP